MIENDALKSLLRDLKDGKIDEQEVMQYLKRYTTESLGFAHVDHHRHLRKGFPEVIFCQGKTNEQIAAIIKSLTERTDHLLATRATRENYDYARNEMPELVYLEAARIISTEATLKGRDTRQTDIIVVSAGTSDIPVAEEAAITAEAFGKGVKRIFDVGVAGIHRLFNYVDELQKAKVVIVTAGMEGALSSVIGGLIDKPVIAVPTSIGYGASFNGLAALLGMLNSCASGVVVVNIDNGFGAGYAAAQIVRSGELTD